MQEKNLDESREKKIPEKNQAGMTECIRIRPINQKELYISDFESAGCLDKNLVVLHDPQYEMCPEDVL